MSKFNKIMCWILLILMPTYVILNLVGLTEPTKFGWLFMSIYIFTDVLYEINQPTKLKAKGGNTNG